MVLDCMGMVLDCMGMVCFLLMYIWGRGGIGGIIFFFVFLGCWLIFCGINVLFFVFVCCGLLLFVKLVEDMVVVVVGKDCELWELGVLVMFVEEEDLWLGGICGCGMGMVGIFLVRLI